MVYLKYKTVDRYEVVYRRDLPLSPSRGFRNGIRTRDFQIMNLMCYPLHYSESHPIFTVLEYCNLTLLQGNRVWSFRVAGNYP